MGEVRPNAPPKSIGACQLQPGIVTAERAGSPPLIANRTAIGAWETFDPIDLGGGRIALRAHANGRYVTAERPAPSR